VGKPYSGTSPKPQWLYRRATEFFGPAGRYWGVIVDKLWLDEGADDTEEKIAHALVTFWWRENLGDERNCIQHVGGTVFCGRRKGKDGNAGAAFTDEDAFKKAVTDATVKAMSLVGFAGDIFMGLHDDSKYVADLKAEFEEQDAEDEEPSTNNDHPSNLHADALHTAAGLGTAALRSAWEGMFKSLDQSTRQHLLRTVLPVLKEVAAQADAANASRT
jgi:hypothetical protein